MDSETERIARRPTVAVTGATAGVGRATAVEFARQGYRVALIARDVDRLNEAAAEVEQAGGEALILQADVADSQAVLNAAERIVRQWGGIDVWVNNAMVTAYSPVAEMSPDEFRRIVEVTFLGYVYGTMAALEHMRFRDSGTIVQVGSALAHRAIPLQSAYCAAKFAIRGFTESLRCELIRERSGVRVTMVQLPAVNTPQFDWARNRMPMRPQPVPPIFQPEPIARAIYEAARKAPREVWIGRSTMQAILGNMVMPGLLDRLLARMAVEGQMSDEPVRSRQPDNLYSPVSGNYGAHGRFDNRASRRVFALTAAQAKAGIGLALGGLIAGAIALGVSRSRPRRMGVVERGRRRWRQLARSPWVAQLREWRPTRGTRRQPWLPSWRTRTRQLPSWLPISRRSAFDWSSPRRLLRG